MKTTHTCLFALAALGVAITNTNAQSLGTAADYDIFVMNGGNIELLDFNQLYGQVGFSDASDASKAQNAQAFDGTVFAHQNAKFSPSSSFVPSGGVQKSAAIDSALNQANADLTTFINDVNVLTSPVVSAGDLKTGYSFSTSDSVSVLRFKNVDIKDMDFTLTGRAGQSDRIIIRVDSSLTFENANVNLVNLDKRDVIWYNAGGGNFDLHRGAPPNQFTGTIVSPTGQIIIGESDFTGAIYGTDLKLGSGFSFTGSSVPEPSAMVMLFSSIGVLLLIRRRKN